MASRRQILSRSVGAIAVVALLALAFPFLASLAPNPDNLSALRSVEVSGLGAGEFVLLKQPSSHTYVIRKPDGELRVFGFWRPSREWDVLLAENERGRYFTCSSIRLTTFGDRVTDDSVLKCEFAGDNQGYIEWSIDGIAISSSEGNLRKTEYQQRLDHIYFR